MIYPGTVIEVCDNTGVSWIRCIRVLNKGRLPKGTIGSILVASVVSVKKESKNKKGDLIRALVVWVKGNSVSSSSSYIKYSSNKRYL